ncbi:hypothetical protein N7474_005937 [Penicillium riverlandense]|uniref:uncharacterized protein n=1 Tax=Penicillium riverlandense TaxID=1903569 RepID=UPI0025489267|nr:uncharacterized protein N7474_005937 [Penicillium riverlandense]KAJ5820346.1 hypothetical protein N7474_005937 [Penicillium riverlandense]
MKTTSKSHTDDRRVRELYRYYQPLVQESLAPSWLPPGADDLPSSDPASTVHTPSADGSANSNSSATSQPSTATGPESLILGTSNNTLTSFAQLAAVRLNVDRALICVLDRDAQFVLAEATPSLNLNETTIHDHDDEFWLGSTGSRKAWPIFQDTVALPTSDRQNAQHHFLEVKDMSQHARFKHLPFVENQPHYKFYAGVPLTTEKNINLGCFCVLSSEPREGLTALEQDTLGSLASLVMDYFKVSRQASEGRRAARLSRGLAFFVEGSSSFVDNFDPSCTGSSVHPSTTHPSSSLRSTNQRISFSGGSREHSLGNAPQIPSHSPGNDRSSSNDSRSLSSGASVSKLETGGSSDYVTGSLPEWLPGTSRNQLPPDDSHANSWCFRRAANLLRESLDLSRDGGVIFLEANSSPMLESDHGNDCSSDSGGPAPILSMSTYDDPFSPRAGSTVSCAAANLDRSFLQTLLRRYPKGKLWSFHRDGLISTSDDDDDQHVLHRGSPTGSNNRSPSGGAPTIEVSKPVRRRRKAAENSMLNKYFPKAAQIMFVPLWNAATSQWFAGCFCWSTTETQVFTSAVELSSVLGFGSSIMAEYSRVESLIADRQKGDFIGSISHELRSPLHGILAAAEFLHGTNMNEFQESLLETINSCGRTLLDTMNQVLDFSKIVSLERTWQSMKRRKESPLDFKGTDKLAAHLDSYVVTDLAVLAEEVVEGICLGHAYGQSSTASADLPVLMAHNAARTPAARSNVDVIIDVAHHNWIYRTQPGALRRIIMNVFGNAMKYTDAGRVSIRLEAQGHSEGRSRRQGLEDLVTLTISDTGKGISEEFLRGRLYTPFAQEDSLAVGTGLGLSIVRSLVKALNGNIRIRSRPGEGTVVRVSLPLARPVGEESPPIEPHGPLLHQKETLAQTYMLQEGYSGKRAAIWGVDPAHALDSSWNEIVRYFTDWFGFELVPWRSHQSIDVLVIDEQDLPALRSSGPSTSTLSALLILCHRSVDYSVVCSEWLPLASSVDIIRRPCGPHKLARSILKCLQHLQPGAVSPSIPQDRMDLPIRTSAAQSTVGSDVADDSATTILAVSPPPTPRTERDEIIGNGPISTEERSPDGPSVVTPPPEIVAAAPLPPPLAEGSVNSRRLARVLVVDDNRINLNLMMTFMRKRKLTELDAAENGKQAVEAVEAMPNGYNIIFMDMSMPVMNGFEATRAIRSLERERDGYGPAIIIALTGLSSSRDESEALASGVDLFLTKPVSFREVARLLEEWEKDGLVNERKRVL